MGRTVRHIKVSRSFIERNPKGSMATRDIVTKAVLTWVLDMLEGGQSVAMASVIEASGSVPGKPGARMAVTESGARFGTVGGAGLEMNIYPYASELHPISVNEFLQREDSDSLTRFSDILLLGHDWSVDQDMLLGLLEKSGGSNRPRIGAIGSKAKWKSFREAAISQGISESVVDSVRCPIGLEIGAESPEEIAVAVCAEIMTLEKA